MTVVLRSDSLMIVTIGFPGIPSLIMRVFFTSVKFGLEDGVTINDIIFSTKGLHFAQPLLPFGGQPILAIGNTDSILLNRKRVSSLVTPFFNNLFMTPCLRTVGRMSPTTHSSNRSASGRLISSPNVYDTFWDNFVLLHSTF